MDDIDLTDLPERIGQMEPIPGEPAWLALYVLDVVGGEDGDLQEIIADRYYEIETRFESMVDLLEQHIGVSDPDLEQEVPEDIREGIKEPVFWRMPDEGLLMLGWIHESNEAPIEILAARLV